MATPQLTSGRYYLDHTPHLLSHYTGHDAASSSSSPMLPTPNRIGQQKMATLQQRNGPYHAGDKVNVFRANGVSTASISSNSSQDSNASASTSQATSLLSAADVSSTVDRAQSRSPAPLSNGFGYGFSFPPASSGVAAPVKTDAGSSNGLVAAAAIAAEAEAVAQSEAEEAASILVHSVATTPRHHRKGSSMSQFPPLDHDGDVMMQYQPQADIPVHATSTPTAGRPLLTDDASPCPTLPSFCTSSPAMSSAPPSREQGHLRSILPTTSPSMMQPYPLPPTSSRSVSEASFNGSQLPSSASKAGGNKRKAGKRNGGAGGVSEVATDPSAKPPFSYAGLIGQAILSTSDHRLSLNDIYVFIMTKYPFYKKEEAGWQNSIRHNLSLNECFVKTARDANNPGKGCLWSILAGTEDQFADGNFVKRSAMGKKKAQQAAQAGKSEPGVSTGPSSSGPSTNIEIPPPRPATAPKPKAAPAPPPVAKPPPRRAAAAAVKRAVSREVSPPPSDVVYDEEEDDEAEENDSEDDYAPPGQPGMPIQPPRKRQRQEGPASTAPSMGVPALTVQQSGGNFLTSPALSTSRAMAVFPPRAAATSPPPFQPGPLSPPSHITARMSKGHEGYGERVRSRSITPAAQAIMSSPPPVTGLMGPGFWPPSRGSGFLQAAATIGPSHSMGSLHDDDEKPSLTGGALATQSPVSSMRSNFVPIASPRQKQQAGKARSSQITNAHDALASLRTSNGAGGASNLHHNIIPFAPQPIASHAHSIFSSRSVSPPATRPTSAQDLSTDALLRTPPSSSRALSTRQTPRRPASTPAGLLQTPRGRYDWRMSSDPYDPAEVTANEVDRLGQRSPEKGPMPFSTPGTSWSPW